MIKEAIATGSTVDAAREAAIQQLSAGSDEEIQFEIIDLPQKKTLGLFGGCPAKVRAFVVTEEKTAPAAEKKPERPESRPRPEKKQYDKPATAKKPSQSAPRTAPKTAPVQSEAPADSVPELSEEKPVEKRPITDEVKKKIADSAIEYLQNILRLMEVKADIKAAETDSAIELTLDGEGLGIIVGRHGDTLDALQYLTVLSANRVDGAYHRILLDTGNYRERRKESLCALARKMAQQVNRTGRNSTLEPMNPYERRIIHTAVQDIKGVTSWSVGSEPMRRVVIGRAKGEGGRNNYRSDRTRRDNRQSQSAPAPAQPERESKTDLDTAPLYGRIG